jgi:hypothetical protein
MRVCARKGIGRDSAGFPRNAFGTSAIGLNASLGTCRSGSSRFYRTPWREALGNGSRICPRGVDLSEKTDRHILPN